MNSRPIPGGQEHIWTNGLEPLLFASDCLRLGTLALAALDTDYAPTSTLAFAARTSLWTSTSGHTDRVELIVFRLGTLNLPRLRLRPAFAFAPPSPSLRLRLATLRLRIPGPDLDLDFDAPDPHPRTPGPGPQDVLTALSSHSLGQVPSMSLAFRLAFNLASRLALAFVFAFDPDFAFASPRRHSPPVDM
ncbi:hypothetical protein VTO73DRAFT_218 [Trametes versicolor]